MKTSRFSDFPYKVTPKLPLRGIFDLKEKIKCYDKTLELNPKEDMAWNNKGWALDGLGKYEEAIKCYDQALALNPENNKAKNNKSSALKKLTKLQNPSQIQPKNLILGTYSKNYEYLSNSLSKLALKSLIIAH